MGVGGAARLSRGLAWVKERAEKPIKSAEVMEMNDFMFAGVKVGCWM